MVDRKMAEEIAAEFGVPSDAVFDATEGLVPRRARSMVRRATEHKNDAVEMLERWAREDLKKLDCIAETNKYARERKLGWAAKGPQVHLLLRSIEDLYKRRIMTEYLLDLGRIPESGFDAGAELTARTEREREEGKLSTFEALMNNVQGVRDQVKDAFNEIGLDALLAEAGTRPLDDRSPELGPYSYEYYLELLRMYHEYTVDLEAKCRRKLEALRLSGYPEPMGHPDDGIDWTQ